MRSRLLLALLQAALVASGCGDGVDASGSQLDAGGAAGVSGHGAGSGDASLGGASGKGGAAGSGGAGADAAAGSAGTGNPLPTCGAIGGTLCEVNGNGACGGVGEQTSDCDHCCNPPPCSYPINPVGTGSLFVHYVGVPAQPIMDALAGKGDNVMTTRSVVPCGTQDATFKYWRAKGGRWAYKLFRDDALAEMGADPVAWFKAKIDQGWDYVAFDEFRDSNQGFHDGTAEGQMLIAMMNALPPPYEGRFIGYWSSGGIGDITTAYPNMVKTIAAKGRGIMLERYLFSSAEHSTATLQNTFFNPQCTKTVALAAGVKAKLGIVLGIDNYDPGGKGEYIYLDRPNTDLATDASGMLYREFAALHAGSCTNGIAGVGTYTFGRVTDLPQYTAATLAQRLRAFEDWWP